MSKKNFKEMFDTAASIEGYGDGDPEAALRGEYVPPEKKDDDWIEESPENEKEEVKKEKPISKKASNLQESMTAFENTEKQSSEDFKMTITKTIGVLNTLREQDPAVNNSIKTFLQLEEKASESEVVYAVLTYDKDTIISLSSIIKCKKLEQVESAFYLMGLDNYKLKSIGELSSVFVKDVPNITCTPEDNKIGYCKELLSIINAIPKNVTQNLGIIEKLFSNALL